MVLADREGHQLVETQGFLTIKRHQLGADGAQPHPLPHGVRRHAEPGGDLLGAPTLLVAQGLEGLELVRRVHVVAGDVLVQGDFEGIVGGVDDAADRLVLPDGPALGQQGQGKAAPLADGDEVAAGRLARRVRLGLHGGIVDQGLGRDAARQGLDGLQAVRGLPGVPGRLLQPVQRYLQHHPARVRRGGARRPGGRFGGGYRRGVERFGDICGDLGRPLALAHGGLPFGYGCRRKARLQPCPSARPGVQAERAPSRGTGCRAPALPSGRFEALRRGPKLGGRRSEARRGRSPKPRTQQ